MDPGPLGGGRSRTGWIAFAGVYLIVAGVMNGIWGLAALSDSEVLRERALAWSNLTTWGWLSVGAAAHPGRRRRPRARAESRRPRARGRASPSAACS